MKRLDRVERRTCWEENGVCIELESDLFLKEMTADREGRGVAILTPALVSGTTKLIGDPRPALTSFLLRNFFSPPLVFLPSPF